MPKECSSVQGGRVGGSGRNGLLFAVRACTSASREMRERMTPGGCGKRRDHAREQL